MTIKEFKKWLFDNNVPDDAQISFWGNGDGSFYQITDEVDYDAEKRQVCIGY